VVFGDVMACGSSRKLRSLSVRVGFCGSQMRARALHPPMPAGGGPRATTGMRHPERPGLQYKEMSLRGVQGWPDRRTP
jgi:hypothetical protein